MKIIVGIVAGYILGIVSVFIYQVFEKPALPTEPKEEGPINFIKISAGDVELAKFLIKSEYNRSLSEECEEQ